MRSRFVPALAVVACAVGGVERAAALDPPALTLQLGRAGLAGSSAGAGWSGGTFAGNVALDFSLSAPMAVVLVAGTSRGFHGSFDFGESDEIDSDYLVAAIRFISEPPEALRPYFLAGYGVLRANDRSTVYYSDQTTSVFHESNSGGAGLLAVGLIFTVPGSRIAIVGEGSALLPQDRNRVPQQYAATLGLRIPLRS